MMSPAAFIKALIFRYGTSFRRKALWVAIPGLIITSIVYTYDAVRAEKAIMKGEITKRAEVVANLASRMGELPLLSGNPELMKEAISLLKSVPEVSFVAFYNNKMELLMKEGPDISKQRMKPDEQTIKIFEDNDYFDLYAPVFTVRAKEDFDIFQEGANRTDIRENAGYVRIGFSKASMKKEEQMIIFRGLMFAVIFTFAIGWLVYYMFTLAARPLSMLQRALGGVRKGQYPEILISSNDEAGMLACEYNKMAEAVKDRETRLRDSEKRTRELFDRVDHAIFRLDKEGNIKEANRKFNELCGGAGRFSELFADKPKSVSLESIRDSLKNVEERITGRDGEEIVVLMSLYPEFDEKHMLAGFDGHFVDITEKKRLEEALFQTQKLESLGLLAGGVAHDFNNILTGILGYSSLMKHMVPEKDVMHGYLDTIERSARRAAGLAGQLLGFARKGKYKTERLCVNDITRELSVVLKETFDRGITVVLSAGEDIPPIEGDGTQIYQALLNLCINARDAMPGGGKLYLKTDTFLHSPGQGPDALQLPAGRYVSISVTDTGMGIDPEIRDRIFEPFFTTKDTGKGTGLGLAMVYGIIKNHGGHITVHSKPGLGTTMVICFPGAEGLIEEKSLKRQIVERPEKGSILIIDDEEVIRVLGKDILEVWGYEVHSAINGVEGIRIFREHGAEINLVILDMVMPEMNGSQTFREIRAISPDTKVLLCSGYGKEHYIQELIVEGAAGFLQKPFHYIELVAKVKEIMGG
jgi:two-component system, cell cycle sensor histidine kinase and response regulator CckA